jgi:hypothetical protein
MAGLILSVLLLTAGGPAPPSGTCTCPTEDKPLDGRITEQVKKADLIFEGVVLETHDYPSAEARRLANEDSSHVRFSFGDRRYAFFFVSKSWKGSYKRDLVVSTLRSESMCGYPFEEEKRYLVYVSAGEWGPTTSICMRTRPVAEAAEDKKKLEELFAVIPREFDADSGTVLRTARRLADAQGYSPRAYAADLLIRIGETPFVLKLNKKGDRIEARLECRSADLPGQTRKKAEAFLDEVDKRVTFNQR